MNYQFNTGSLEKIVRSFLFNHVKIQGLLIKLRNSSLVLGENHTALMALYRLTLGHGVIPVYLVTKITVYGLKFRIAVDSS